MTQEEVDLIYNYLHENYEYLGQIGCLINKKSKKVMYGSTTKNINQLRIDSSIRINNRKYSMLYSHLLWIYFYKDKPKLIGYKDNNPSNIKIENLVIGSMSLSIINNDTGRINKHGYRGVCKCQNAYYGRLFLNKKFIWSRAYKTPEEAHQAYLDLKKQYAIN